MLAGLQAKIAGTETDNDDSFSGGADAEHQPGPHADPLVTRLCRQCLLRHGQGWIPEREAGIHNQPSHSAMIRAERSMASPKSSMKSNTTWRAVVWRFMRPTPWPTK